MNAGRGHSLQVDWLLPVGAVGAVVASWSQVRGDAPAVDIWARRFARTHDNSTAFAVLDGLKDIGSFTYAAPIILALFTVISVRRATVRPLSIAAVALLVAAGSTWLLKTVAARPGPSGVAPPAVDGAWPSGHAVTVVVAALLLVSLLSDLPTARRWAAATGVVVTVVVGVGLVYCNHHWLTDVLVAVPVGYLAVWVATTMNRPRPTPGQSVVATGISSRSEVGAR